VAATASALAVRQAVVVITRDLHALTSSRLALRDAFFVGLDGVCQVHRRHINADLVAPPM
jgi:hypothetical protein